MALSDFHMTEKDAENVLSCYLHSKILEIFAYGIYTVIYCVAFYLTLSRGREKSQVRTAILIITILWILSTIHATLRWTSVNHIFVRYAESRESELMAIISVTRISEDVTSFIVLFLSVLIADLTMIWRCWVLYGRRWIIIVIPVLSLAAGTVAEIFQGIAWLGSRDSVAASVSQNTWYIIFLSTSVFTNIFCTATIIYRLVSVTGFAKAFKTYHGILEILIESAVMYTAIYLVQIGLRVYGTYFAHRWDPRFLYAQSLTNVITGIAPTFIIARVAAGHARPDNSWRIALPRIETETEATTGSLHFFQSGTCNETGTEVDLERCIEIRNGQGEQSTDSQTSTASDEESNKEQIIGTESQRELHAHYQ